MNESIDIPAMLAGYLDCVLWASCDESGNSLDAEYFPTDIDGASQNEARADCVDFVLQCSEQNIDLEALPTDSARIGHDIWLTRNHHGAGFWDRGYGVIGDRLTDIAHAMGSCDAYVGDNGRVYLS